jgi:hypothetical protein
MDGTVSKLPPEHLDERLILLNQYRADDALLGSADHIVAVIKKTA